MLTNTNMTLYHKSIDTKTRKTVWKRFTIDKVMWQGGKGAKINKGYDNANDVKIFVPIEYKKIPFSIGDIVVKGSIDTEITSHQDLIGDVYNLTTIIYAEFGTLSHIELGAK